MRPHLVNTEEEHIPAAPAACSAEPMRRADHKAKKHGRPMPVRYVRPVKRSLECGE